METRIKNPSYAIPMPSSPKRIRWHLFLSEFRTVVGSIPLIWQILFFYLPLFLLLSASVSKFSLTGTFEGITFAHFQAVLKPSYYAAIYGSLVLAFTTTIICLTIAFPFAYYIAFHGGRFKNLFLFLLIIPFWTNFILHIYAWFFVLERHGFLNTILLHLHLLKEPLPILNSYPSMMIMMVYYYLPFMILPIYSALEKFDPLLLEASLDLGANRLQTIRKILLPLSMNAIRAGIFLVYIPAFGEFVIPELMGGDKECFIGTVISLFVLGEQSFPIGIAFTVLSSFILFLSLILLNGVIRAFSRYLQKGISS